MSKIRTIAAATIVALSAIAPGASLAHHGWSSYDSSQLLKLTGTIETSSYVNPHGSVRLKTPEKTWNVILAPPSRMLTRGLEREVLAPGATVTVEGYPHRTESAELRAERITIDGNTVGLR